MIWKDKRSGINYDIYGAELDWMGNVVNPFENKGIHNKKEDMTDLPLGIYFVELKTKSGLAFQKIILLE